ncbi:DUF1826 domain-containing protein [Marinimicrobium locisalis]|uniref:DUF1826 domain-containing protein n=1 Tax=Marinimicrobium locisalis TaxID=546022 RepID=UPI003221C3A5
MTHYPNGLPRPLVIEGDQAECLTNIFRDDINLAIWRRSLRPKIVQFVEALVQRAGKLERFTSLEPTQSVAGILPAWAQALEGVEDWLADVEQLVNMYRCLFEPAAVGVRLHVIESPMCPRFHVDRVPVRLLCTYQGAGTEWLPEPLAKRPIKPGPLPEQPVKNHQLLRLPMGAVALLKGEAWEGNEGRGVVHRSPPPEEGARVVLGVDWLA